MAGFYQRRQHTDYIVVEYPVVAVFANVQLVAVGNDEGVNIAGLVGVDQLGIRCGDRFNVDDAVQAGVPVGFHVRIVRVKGTLGSQNLPHGKIIATAKAIRADAVVANDGFAGGNGFGVGRRVVQRGQVIADNGQHTGVFGAIDNSHAGVGDFKLVAVNDHKIGKVFNFIVQTALAGFCDEAGQIPFRIVPLDRFWFKTGHAKADLLAEVAPEGIRTVDPGNGRVNVAFPAEGSRQTPKLV